MPYIGNQPAPQNVTSTEITDGTITNADINASAAIDISKLNGVTATATELNYNDITTLGTVEASKVVTADASGNVKFPDSSVRIGTTSGTAYYNSTSTYNVTLPIKTNTANEITELALINGNNNFGSAIDFARTNSASNDVRYAAIAGVADDNTAGSEAGYIKFSTKSSSDSNIIERMRITNAGDVDVSGELIADSYNETYAAVTSSSNATTVDCEAGNAFSHTLTENTTFTFSNPPASGTAYSFSIEIIQDASASGYTVTWPSSVDWPSATAPTLTATASAKDVFVFTTRDGGTNWYGFTAGLALA